MRDHLCLYTERKFRNTGREEVCCVSNKAAVSGENTHLQTHTEYHHGVICDWGRASAAVTFCVTPLGDGFSGAAGSELHLAFRVLLQLLSDQEGTTSPCVQQSTEAEVEVPWFEESLPPSPRAGWRRHSCGRANVE